MYIWTCTHICGLTFNTNSHVFYICFWLPTNGQFAHFVHININCFCYSTQAHTVCLCVYFLLSPQSGLIDACRKSVISLPTAEEVMLDFVMKHTTKGECPLAGNTIYMDKIFLMKYMPRFVDHLHYRLVDVSTVKELARYACNVF